MIRIICVGLCGYVVCWLWGSIPTQKSKTIIKAPISHILENF